MATTSNLKHYLGYGLAVLAILYISVSWVKERELRIRGEAQISARDEAQKKISDEFDKRIASLNPQQAQEVIRPIVLPKVPVGSKIVQPPDFKQVPISDLPKEDRIGLPSAPDAKVTLFTSDQIVELGKRELTCQKTEGALATCKKDKADLQIIVNGGSTWSRLMKEAKCLGFLAGGAGLGAKISGWKGAAIGGVGGELGCKIFF
jgi:hypothetical protein